MGERSLTILVPAAWHWVKRRCNTIVASIEVDLLLIGTVLATLDVSIFGCCDVAHGHVWSKVMLPLVGC